MNSSSLRLRLKPISIPIPTMKRKRPTAKPPAPPHSSTPPPPQTKTLNKTRHSTSTKPTITKSLKFPEPSPNSAWVPLNLTREELSLPLTFPTGQTFRWKNTSPSQFTGVIGPHLLSLTHLQNGDVSYFLHRTPADVDHARTALLDFLNAGVSLTGMWKVFSDSDERFAELAQHLRGARVLRQDPFECLIQFLCSSNNNIGRITKMVDHISSLGTYLGSVEGFRFHAFPTLEQLSSVSEEDLRKAGFGYRLHLDPVG